MQELPRNIIKPDYIPEIYTTRLGLVDVQQEKFRCLRFIIILLKATFDIFFTKNTYFGIKL